jgi:hypothetical protein
MQRRSGIANALTQSTVEYTRNAVGDCFTILANSGLPDLRELDAVASRIIHDIESTDTAPLPQAYRKGCSLTERLIDGAIDMAALLGWYLRKAGRDTGFVQAATLGALLHDCGLLHVSQTLMEQNRGLTRVEFREIKRHPYLGVRALSPLAEQLPRVARDIVLHHHEREDGRGYPLRRSGEGVPEIARLAHIVDSYLALVSHRPHRAAYTPHKAIEILLSDAGRSYNPVTLREFVERIGRYPLGCAVILSTNEVGVVVGQGKNSPFRPVVDVYFSRNHQFSQTARRIELAREQLKYVRQVMR